MIIRNTFHNSEAKFRPVNRKLGEIYISDASWRKLRTALCGTRRCPCMSRPENFQFKDVPGDDGIIVLDYIGSTVMRLK